MQRFPARIVVAICRRLIVAIVVVGITYATVARLRPFLLSHRPLPGGTDASGPCAVWFIGSSTIARWSTLEPDMAPWSTSNRGVANALVGEIVSRFHADGAVRPPHTIVLYVGDNDLAHGADPDAIVESVSQFLADARKRMPGTRIVVLGVKPSPTRWALRGAQRRLDGAIRAAIRGQARVSFADVAPALLIDGRPGPYFVSDGIHLNPDGYRVWGRAVRRAVEASAPLGTAARCRAGQDRHA